MHSVRAHVTFEAAHRLHDDGVYSKKCQTCLHGHSYGVTVYLSSPRLLDCGMVIDFTQLKEILRSVIVEPFDHSCILKKTDPLCMPVSMYCENVHIVDSRRLSTGMAVLALKGIEMIESGASAAEVASNLTAMRDKVSTSFLLDTLTYMNKGGRCSTLAVLGANILGIKPTIENLNDGSLVVGKKYRGKSEAVRRQYIDEKLSTPGIDYSRIFVDHSGIEADEIEELRSYIEDNYDFREVLVSRAGSTISTHCGPGTFALMFMYQ